MAVKADVELSRKILEVVREQGGHVSVRDMRQFKQLVGADCSMNVFKQAVNRLSHSTGKLAVSKTGRHDPHSLEDARLVIRLRKAPVA